MADFNIGDLFENAFGYSMPGNGFFVPVDSKPTVQKNKFSIPENDLPVSEERGLEPYSSLGQPFYASDAYGREYFMPVRLDGYWLPFPVISCNTKHTIIETALTERRGTVKELISAEDWIISIKGIIVRTDNNFPEEELRKLEDLREKGLKGALEMRSALTDIFLKGDDKVIMKSFTPAMITGVEHALAYSMEFVSDLVYDLELS